MKSFMVRIGNIIGAEHQRLQINNQDGYAVKEMEHQGQEYLWGIICDGCSAGAHNEVGAILLANYLCNEVPRFISSGSSLQEIPGQLFIAGLGYLRFLASITAIGSIDEQIHFIKNNLLCTVVGFIMNQENCLLFTAGDGVIIINDEVERIDQNNKPLYMAYHLVDKGFLMDLSDSLALKFDTRELAVDELDRFAICSDGIEEQVIDQLWGHHHVNGLQRKLRVLRLQEKAIFSDDCTVIAVERVKEALAIAEAKLKGGEKNVISSDS